LLNLEQIETVIGRATGNSYEIGRAILDDALAYLDYVQVEYADRPDVYNRFLNIMQEFKSGAIDTPDVIERMSQLLADSPTLIQAFNIFLPPGYMI
jgi:paired amphipathic helix protein Sin3a